MQKFTYRFWVTNSDDIGVFIIGVSVIALLWHVADLTSQYYLNGGK